VLAIFGFAPTLAPMLMRDVRPSLSLSNRFRFSTLHSDRALLMASTPPMAVPEDEEEPVEETAEDTTDSNESLELESVTWLEGTAPSRWVQGPRALASPTDSAARPSRSTASERLRRQTQTLAVALSTPGERAAELCRFLC